MALWIATLGLDHLSLRLESLARSLRRVAGFEVGEGGRRLDRAWVAGIDSSCLRAARRSTDAPVGCTSPGGFELREPLCRLHALFPGLDPHGTA